MVPCGQLAARLQPLARINPSIDGIVAIAHTEGGGPGEPNNSAEVLRALAGFLVHPNVGAVLAVDVMLASEDYLGSGRGRHAARAR